jgi:uncharacterized delta-60 repeat protein
VLSTLRVLTILGILLAALASRADAHVQRVIEFGGNDAAAAVTNGPARTFVVAGTSGTDIVLARMRLDGSLDRSFGRDGRTVVDFGGADDVSAIARDSAGRILVAGATESPDEDAQWLVVRLHADGRLDRGFGGGDGRATIAVARFDASCGSVEGLELTASGTIVLAGVVGCGGESDDGIRAAVARLRSDGQIDRSFSRDGVWTTWSLCGANGLTVQPAGRIVIAGTSGSPDYCGGGDMRLVGIAANGRLDRSFGTRGRTTVEASQRGDSGISDLVRAPSGHLLAAGFADEAGRFGFAIARFDAAGGLDRSFGVWRGPSLGGRSGLASDVSVGPDGGVVAAGWRSLGRDRSQFVLARYSRGRGERQILKFGGTKEMATDVITVAGRTIAVGYTSRGRDSNFAVAII